MNEEMSKQTMQEKRPWGKRVFAFLLAVFMMVQILPAEVFAAWDGSGNSGSSSTTPVTGAYLICSGYGNDMTKHILGYRFSVYDSEGNKLGHSVKIGCNQRRRAV
jgi:uncharacterized RDD family membrane protein YckC